MICAPEKRRQDAPISGQWPVASSQKSVVIFVLKTDQRLGRDAKVKKRSLFPMTAIKRQGREGILRAAIYRAQAANRQKGNFDNDGTKRRHSVCCTASFDCYLGSTCKSKAAGGWPPARLANPKLLLEITLRRVGVCITLSKGRFFLERSLVLAYHF